MLASHCCSFAPATAALSLMSGDANLYTPKAKVVQKGSKITKVEVSMPSPVGRALILQAAIAWA